MSEMPLIDLVHLETQTGGDAALAEEVLALFREQCAILVAGIGDAACSVGERADLAHTLKGSALGVGALRVAQEADRLEQALRTGSGRAGDDARALSRCVDQTLEAIAIRR